MKVDLPETPMSTAPVSMSPFRKAFIRTPRVKREGVTLAEWLLPRH
jgi:hypothetical protein